MPGTRHVLPLPDVQERRTRLAARVKTGGKKSSLCNLVARRPRHFDTWQASHFGRPDTSHSTGLGARRKSVTYASVGRGLTKRQSALSSLERLLMNSSNRFNTTVVNCRVEMGGRRGCAIFHTYLPSAKLTTTLYLRLRWTGPLFRKTQLSCLSKFLHTRNARRRTEFKYLIRRSGQAPKTYPDYRSPAFPAPLRRARSTCPACCRRIHITIIRLKLPRNPLGAYLLSPMEIQWRKKNFLK